MLTGTLITAVGFLPIGIARSSVGEYTFAIFGVTVLALVLSWLVSVYFVPYLGTLLLKATVTPCKLAAISVEIVPAILILFTGLTAGQTLRLSCTST